MATAIGLEPYYSQYCDDPDLAELVDLFVAELPERLRVLCAQFDAHDWNGVRRTAHQLAGAIGSYGFPEITPVVRRLEQQLAADFRIEEVAAQMRELLDHCGRIRGGSPR